MSKCYGCFYDIADGLTSCPYCGFSASGYSTNNWTLKPGTVLNGKYLLGKRLGEGGFGITYLAWDINMQTKVAVKEYYPEGCASRDVTMASGNTVLTTRDGDSENFAEGMKRYVREATILAKFFNLPGIVTVKDFFYENATAYIVMEFIDGISLKEYLKSNNNIIKFDEILKLMEPVISSLSIVHRNNLLHRDISPDNIMIDKSGAVKLIDFGAARQFGENYDKSMTVVLKHGYAPVEQYSSRGNHGEWTDVYAICAVIYRCITGSAPVESIDRLHNDQYIPLKKANKKVPRYVADAIDKGLSINTNDRHQNMEELYSDLYSSIKGRIGKKLNGVYTFLRTLLIILIVLLVLGLIGTIAYRLNIDKFDDMRHRMRQVMGTETSDYSSRSEDNTEEEDDESEQDDESSSKDNSKNSKKKKTDKKSKSDDTTETTEDTEREWVVPDDNSTAAEDISNQSTIPADDASNPKVINGKEVVAGGVLDGHSQQKTVGEILDSYSDRPGEWQGYEDDNGQVYIYYCGYRDGEAFALEFEAYSNDTFRLTGASNNGQVREDYSDFFQSILDAEGN